MRYTSDRDYQAIGDLARMREDAAKKRFSRQNLLDRLDRKVSEIIAAECFDALMGTAQLSSGDVSRAVEYGRMIALERLAEEIREGGP